MVERKAKPKAEIPQQERDLDAAIFRCFNTRDGRTTLEYLRGALINEILGPDATDNQLRYREGQRSVVGLLEMRKARAEKR